MDCPHPVTDYNRDHIRGLYTYEGFIYRYTYMSVSIFILRILSKSYWVGAVAKVWA